MLQQIKQSIVIKEGENPELSETLFEKKTKQNLKKKKEFKIKKSNLNGKKKKRKQQGFTDPIYAGLDSQDVDDDNKLNFGPWVHQGINKNGQIVKVKESLVQSTQNFTPIRRQIDRIQNSNQNTEIYENRRRHSRSETQDMRMYETKNQRQFQELRCSFLKLQMSKSLTLSPLKLSNSKKNQQLNKYSKSKSTQIDLLKYKSMKYLFPHTEKEMESTFLLRKPNAVNYNYCCLGGGESNFLANEYESLLANRQASKWSLNSDYKEVQKQKYERNPLRQTKTLLPIKKSISRQLYDELIKKKTKIK